MRCSTHPAPFRIRSVLPSLLIVVLLYGHGWASSGTKPIQVVLPPLITRNAPPIWIEHPDSLILNAGESRLLHLRAVDPDLNPISFSSFAAPSFVVLVDSGNGSGALVVTPATNVRGRSSMLLIVSDSLSAADSVDFTVIVSRLNSAPVWRELEIDSVRVREGRTVAIRVAVDDPDGDSLIVSSYGTVHSALAKAEEGRYDLVVAPSLGQAGIGSITIIAADYELADTMHIPLIVEQAPGNHPPVWSHPESDSISLLEGAYTTLTPTVSDFDGDPLTISDKSEMETVLTHLGDGVYELVIAPAVGDTGLQYARVIAFDGRDADTLEIAVLVRFNQNRNHPPVINNAPGNISLNINRDTVFVVGATDADGDLVTFTTLYAPTFVSLSERPSSLPHARLVDVYVTPKTAHHGLFQMYLIASDGSLSDSASLLINVSNVNYWPEIGDLGHHTIAESDTMLIVILASDANGSITTLSAFNLPANATFVDHRNNRGTFRFVPSYAQAGQYRVGFIANDGSLRDTAVLDITVLNLPRPPQLAAVSPRTVNEGSTISIPLSATDPDNDHITLYGFALPEHAAVYDNGGGGGMITFAPVIGQIGPFEMSVVATDGSLADTIVVIVTVLQTSVPPDSVAEVQFVTEEIKKYSSAFAIDQLHTEDLDLDGIDEVLFRENVDGNHVLRIWSVAGDSLWVLPPVGMGIKSYTLRSGTGRIEPVVWTNGNELNGLRADRTGWDVIAGVPTTATRVQMLPSNPEGWLAMYSIPIYEQSTFRGEPDGSCLGTRTEHSTRSFGYSVTDTSSAWGLGWAQQLPFDHGSIFQLFNHGLLEELLIHAYYESRSIESCGIPSDYFYATLSLHSFPVGDTGALPLWEHYTVNFDLEWSYGQGRPSPYTYGIGLSRWNDRTDTTLKVCFAGHAGEASAYNTTEPYALNILTRGIGWEIAEARFALPATPTRGGVITISGEGTETMLLAPDAGFGYIISIPQAEFQGRLAMPAPGRFKSGYVIDASHRDIVLKISNGVAVYRVNPYVPPRDSALVHHVPGDYPTIQGAINAALSGDTILVAPGSYPGSIDFLGKDICLKSSAGAQSTYILPASTTRPAVRFAGGESEAAILDGFTIRLGSTSMVAIENDARPIIRNNVFREQQGSGDVISIKSVGAIITRNIFTGNTNARCIDVWGSGSARIISNTFDRNSRGVNSSSATTIFYNNILSNHSGNALSGLFDSLDYNALWANNPDYRVTSYLRTPKGRHDLSVEPHYLNSGLGDYRLSGQSICIDNGHPGVAYQDSDGSIADIGSIPYTRVQFPSAANLDIRVEDRWHLINENPVIDWKFLGESGQSQHAVEMEVGLDQDWTTVEVWRSGEVQSSTNSLIYTGPNLADGDDYYIRVRLRDNQKWGTWSEEGVHTNGVPSTPELQFPPNATTVNPDGVALTCIIGDDPEGDSVFCEFEVAADPNFQSIVLASEATVTDTGWVFSELLSDLEGDLQYWWRARATDHLESTSWSSTRTFGTTTGTISVPLHQPTIQSAIRAAATGDTVLVSAGAYDVNLDFLGKGVYLKSELGANLTLLRPLDSTKSVISITRSEPAPCAVDGFTISGCKTASISVHKSRPVIRNNVIGQNRSAIGASYTMGLRIEANAIRDNGMGSAPNWGNATISLLTCDSTVIVRNVAYGNTGYGIISSAEGRGRVINNTLIPKVGHAIRTRNGSFQFYNNIVVGSPEYAVDQSWYSTITADYNCTYDNQTDYLHAIPGPGSIYSNPQFVNPAAGDFRLAANSPCIDAGHPDPQYNDPDGTRNDIGAFPFVPGVSALHPDDHNGDGTVDVRDAVRLIDLTVRKSESAEATVTSDQIRVRGLIRRIWGTGEARK